MRRIPFDPREQVGGLIAVDGQNLSTGIVEINLQMIHFTFRSLSHSALPNLAVIVSFGGSGLLPVDEEGTLSRQIG